MKVKVKLYDTVIGILEDVEGSYYFKYTDYFIKSGLEVSPIRMRLSEIQYNFDNLDFKPFYGLPGLLADSLPDKYGNDIIERWLTDQGRDISSFTQCEKLCYIGKRGMGALEYEPVYLKNDSSVNINIDRLVDLANDIVNKKETVEVKESNIMALIKIGTSAGGARAKAIVAYNEKLKKFKSGQTDAGEGYEYYILKFDGIENNKDKDNVDSIYQTRIEYAYYLMARFAGINMSESRLIEDNNRYHFLTKRFDRYVENGKMHKVHMQSLCAIDHIRFDEHQNYSYVHACQIMKKMGLGQKDIEQFYRRMVFNVMARNQDDHVKNVSFLMDKYGKWRLSPAYDITYAYDPMGKWTNEHQMLVNGKGKNILYEDLVKCGIQMDIKASKINEIIMDVKRAVLKFKDFSKEANLPDSVSDDLFAHFELLD